LHPLGRQRPPRLLNETVSTSAPQLSVIIAVYIDWEPLDHCLRSLEQQIDAPKFEIIIVDDGNKSGSVLVFTGADCQF
jgi:GT2 family glycosyltransferase